MKGFIDVTAPNRDRAEDSLGEDTETKGWALEAASQYIIELDEREDLPETPPDPSSARHVEVLKELQTLQGFLGCAIYSTLKNEVTVVAIRDLGEDIGQLILQTYELFERKQLAVHLMNINESIEELILTLGQACCLVRVFGPERSDFVCIVLDRAVCNVAIARLSLIQLGVRSR